jgi:hypothetical protein
MAFPKKHTRTIWLRTGQEFQWHLNPDWEWKNRWLVVAEKDKPGQFFFVDPYHYKFLPDQVTIVMPFERLSVMDGRLPNAKRLFVSNMMALISF